MTTSSGNVFADLGLAEPAWELTRAQLASHIWRIVQRRRLTRQAAAEAMGVDESEVAAILDGCLSGLSSERLMDLLTALGRDVEIVVKAKPRGHLRGRVRVV